MSKKFMIRSDIEGVTGVVSYEQAWPIRPEFGFGQKMFMSDLLACIHGLREGGAGEIVICDEHYWGRNVDVDALPEGVSAILGKPPYTNEWAGGLDQSFAGMVMVGFHAMMETPNATLAHTYELDIRKMHLNGKLIGEIGMESAIAGEQGVPMVLLTADDAGAKEGRDLIPGLETVVVKESVTETGAICHPMVSTAKWICEASRKIAEKLPPVKPLVFPGPAVLELEFFENAYLRAVQELFPNDLKDSRTLVVKGKNATDVWAKYWQMKFRAQRIQK